MATRSTIAIEYANGQVDQVYCHWDGYLDHNGKLLLGNYMDPFKLQRLIDLGDISSLGEEVGEAHPFSPFTSNDTDPAEAERIKALHEKAKEAGWTTFYGRDRNEEGTGAKRFADFADYKKEHQYEEYEYILRQVDGKAVWFVAMYGKDYVPLVEAIAAEAAEREAVAA